MRRKALFSLPAESLATKWASSFIKRYVVFSHIGALREYLTRQLSRRRLFEITSPTSDVIIITGHGAPDRVAGHAGIIMSIDAYRNEEVSGKSIYMLACQSGLNLAPDMIQHGAKVVYAYDEDFVALIDLRYLLAPFADKIAEQFFKPACMGMKMLVEDDVNYQQVYEEQQRQFNANAAIVDDEDPEMAAFLMHNAEALVYYHSE